MGKKGIFVGHFEKTPFRVFFPPDFRLLNEAF